MDSNISNSELNSLISPEIKDDEFYTAIQKLAQEEDIKTVLEIGSSSGQGSTEALVTGLRKNPNKPTLFCIEVSKPRFTELQKRYADDLFVKCHNVSSIALEQFPDENKVITFYNTTQTALNNYSLERVLSWLNQDIEYVRSSEVLDNGIKKIKQENNINFLDLVLIDGSEFTGGAELDEVYGANFILLDNINSFKNNNNLIRLSTDCNYSLIAQNWGVRNGYAIFKKKTAQPNSYRTIQPVVEVIEGFMVPGQEEYLFNKVKLLPDNAVIVEIGSYKGRSTVAMTYACIGTSRKIYCIDTWDGNNSDFPDRDFLDIWQQNLQKNNLYQYVVPLCGYSHDILDRWNEITDGKAIDFIFIDGSHQFSDVLKDFELSFPLVKSGGWVAFHDVVHTWPGPERVWHEIAKLYLVNHEYSSTLACGQKTTTSILSASSLELPIHFLTIALNGEPFIRYHIELFKQLPFRWHWHIVEGVAELKHDTAWSLQFGGQITDEIHHNGHSYDGTTEYLDELARQYPENITVYRKPEGIFWSGKREMVNEPLFNINEECLLWQVDVDELWTVKQICTARQMFINNPEKTAAFYWCWYFVGENLVISTRNCYAQNPQQEWLRTWRFKPGAVWSAHEPPVLVEPLPGGQWRNIATVNPFLHEETEEQGLVFQHFAYTTPDQLQFKEQYYGYTNALSQWMELQAQVQFPVLLRDYFPWVQDGAQVDLAKSHAVVPIAQREPSREAWRFLQLEELQRQAKKTERSSLIVLIDGIFFQLRNTGIARVWRSLLEKWVENGFAKHVVVLDRAGTAPKISGIRYRSVPLYDYKNTSADREMLQQVCDEEGANLFISTYYTIPLSTPSVFIAYDMVPEVTNANLETPMWREKHEGIHRASAYVAISENTARDLVKVFPNISPEAITVAHCGVKSTFSPSHPKEVGSFKTKYGISKPYFVLVGVDSGRKDTYKNTILFFRAFSRLCSRQAFDIVCTGGGLLEDELRDYTSGSAVHMLRLNDEELRSAYSGALALVYPSKYEGFGLPVLEAMACGCPVITCPNASIPEVAGEAALYVYDNDVNGLVNALFEVQKPDVRNSLIAAGLEQAKKFSWSAMAKIVSSALLEAAYLVEQKSVSLPSSLISLSSCIEQYQRSAEQSVLAELCQARRQLANLWLGTSVEQLVDAYRGSIGKAHQTLLNSGIKNEQLSSAEQIFVAELASHIAKCDEPKAIQYLLAAMLYSRADQLPLQYDLTRIPYWLLNDYLQFLLDSPRYLQEIGEADSYRQYMAQLVGYLHNNIISNPNSKLWKDIAIYFTEKANFVSLYFNNENLKDIYTKRADIIEFSLKNRGCQIDHEFPERSSERKKICLGILATHFGPQTETFATLPVYKHLNRNLFEIILFTLNTSNHRLERYCAGHADALVKLPSDLPSQVQSIREAELDILFISTNVTLVTHPITLLALHRLARLQIVDANSPVTTGMRHVDYYISSKLSELEAAQQYYTETLVTLDCPPQCFDFGTEEQLLATTSISRESLGIRKNAVVYVSGANYYKIIPELEAAWAKVIANVPNSILLLYPFSPNWSSSYPAVAFQKRIAGTFSNYGMSDDRLMILDSAPNRADVKERLKLGDVYLDSYPYSGMTSLIDPLELGLPTVVWEAEFSRSKKGASLLRELQISNLIADSEEAYIQLAIALGKNPELRKQKSDQIKQRMQENPKFLDSRAYSAQIGAVFQELFQKQQVTALKDNLNLKDINLIIFPDWSQPEDLLLQDLSSVVRAVVAHPNKSQMTLLIDTGDISEEDANLALSTVVMNLLMDEDLDVTDGPEISLIGRLSEVQWQALLPSIQARIVLERESQTLPAKLVA